MEKGYFLSDDGLLQFRETGVPYKPVISDVAQYAIDTLKTYATQTGNLPRSTSDLSPLEQWLLIELFKLNSLK